MERESLPLHLLDQLKLYNNALDLGHDCRGFSTTASTNRDAFHWAQNGAHHGSLVLTEFQSAGRGRLGRVWESAAGKNLIFSIILRPKFKLEQWPLITFAAAISISEVLNKISPKISTQVKWPNDILVNTKKCGGILLETNLKKSETHLPFAILGIGLNLNQGNFSDNISDVATSLFQITGHEVNRAQVLADILSRLSFWLQQLSAGRHEHLLSTYKKHLTGIGKSIVLHEPSTGKKHTGTFFGVSPDGALLLSQKGHLTAFYAGYVSFSPPKT